MRRLTGRRVRNVCLQAFREPETATTVSARTLGMTVLDWRAVRDTLISPSDEAGVWTDNDAPRPR